MYLPGVGPGHHSSLSKTDFQKQFTYLATHPFVAGWTITIFLLFILSHHTLENHCHLCHQFIEKLHVELCKNWPYLGAREQPGLQANCESRFKRLPSLHKLHQIPRNF